MRSSRLLVGVLLPHMRVRLIKKLAERIDDVNLKGASVGDVLDLGEREARLLIAEDWATGQERRQSPSHRVKVERRRRDSALL
jgi:hypothetical protein